MTTFDAVLLHAPSIGDYLVYGLPSQQGPHEVMAAPVQLVEKTSQLFSVSVLTSVSPEQLNHRQTKEKNTMNLYLQYLHFQQPQAELERASGLVQ